MNSNVLVTLSDKKIPVDVNNDFIADYYKADIVSAQDYYPFGMLEPGRNFNSTSYKFGFNGQLKDDELKGSGNAYSFKFRMYDPRLGRFMSVDPLSAKYPFYSPYIFSGDRVIDAVELEGLEPSKNPEGNNTNVRAAKADVLTIGSSANNNNKADNYPNSSGPLLGHYSNNSISGGIGSTSENGVNYISDTQQKSAEQFNMFVGNKGAFYVDESNAGNFKNYESFVTNKLLQNFITGKGPENYVFPANGIISKKFLQSGILAKAVNAFAQNKGQTTQYHFGARELFRNTIMNKDAFNISGLVGSGTITIIPNENSIYIKIFNVTSLSSGAYAAKMPFSPFGTPKSYVRENKGTTPFGNISETFSLTLPYNQKK